MIHDGDDGDDDDDDDDDGDDDDDDDDNDDNGDNDDNDDYVMMKKMMSQYNKSLCIFLWVHYIWWGSMCVTCLTFSAWASNHIPSKVWDKMTYPFPSFNFKHT